jgi:hypothetical protein
MHVSLKEENSGLTSFQTGIRFALPNLEASVQVADFSPVIIFFHDFSAIFTRFLSRKGLIFRRLGVLPGHRRYAKRAIGMRNMRGLAGHELNHRHPRSIIWKAIQQTAGKYGADEGRKGRQMQKMGWIVPEKGRLMGLDQRYRTCYGLGHDIECSASCTGGRRRYRRRRWGLSKLNEISTKTHGRQRSWVFLCIPAAGRS